MTKEKTRFIICLISFCIMLSAGGCSNQTIDNQTMAEQNTEAGSIEEQTAKNQNNNTEQNTVREDITQSFLAVYGENVSQDKKNSQEAVKQMVSSLGEKGYAAVDSDHQVDMTCAKQVTEFCRQIAAKRDAEVTILELDALGGIAQYDVEASESKVAYTRTDYIYQNGSLQQTENGSYQVTEWTFADEEYFMLEGIRFHEQNYVLTLSDDKEYVAFRVKPLDETCREYNRQYILPVGYNQNNMFITNWSETDYAELNFYDAYDIFYQEIFGNAVPYVMSDNLSTGIRYQIPKDSFEQIIMPYFKIDSETLQAHTKYLVDKSAYEYRPRGLYDGDYCDVPFPEVIKYKNQEDGTIVLTVQAVFPNDFDAKLFTHETVVRPMEDDGVQYVSNKVLTMNSSNGELWWHAERLNDEDWEKFYINQN